MRIATGVSEMEDLWKSRARSLQLRLRDRFRIAVDRHRRLPVFSTDGYFSSTVKRWLLRFRDFRRDSFSSSSVFYRKRAKSDIDDTKVTGTWLMKSDQRLWGSKDFLSLGYCLNDLASDPVGKDIGAEEDSVFVRMLQAIAVPVIGNVCYVFMHGLNRVQVYGAEKLHEALLNRPENKPLITVSNHVAAMDDPLVIASLLPPSVLLDARSLRWTMCATDRCFKNPVTSAFFRCVKVLPVSRGDGIYQKGMDLAVSKLNTGGWVHIFPEGSRSRDGGKTIGSAKRGVGRLVLDADNTPIVVPFVHIGMQEIMPIGANIPRIGQAVTVLIGDPIRFDDLLNKEQSISRGELYDAVSSRIAHRLQELKVQVERLALEHSIELQNHHNTQTTERAAGILHQVDWESFGMESYIITSGDDDSSSRLELQSQTRLKAASNTQEPTTPSERYFRMGFSYEFGIASRIRGYNMDPREQMGFAARGLFLNRKAAEEKLASIQEIRPLKAWKQLLEANINRLHQ